MPVLAVQTLSVLETPPTPKVNLEFWLLTQTVSTFTDRELFLAGVWTESFLAEVSVTQHCTAIARRGMA